MSSAADKPQHVRAFLVSLSIFLALVAFIFRQRHLLSTTDGATITHFSGVDGKSKQNYR